MAHHIPAKELAWRRRQKPGAIMKSSTFKRIERKARKRYPGISEKRLQQIAGKAYWTTEHAKYKRSRRRTANVKHRRTR